MSLIEDEQDDDNIFDQLKSIKPFTVDQLYLLHPDVGCPSKQSNSYYKSELNSKSYHDQNLYQNLVEYEQLRNKLKKLTAQVKQLRIKTFDHIDKVWIFNEEAPRKIGMCQQGKIAETTFKYKKANINKKQLGVLETSFSELTEVISKDYIYYSFESQIKRHKIATQLSISYQIEDQELRKNQLKSSITTIVDFIKHLGDSRSDFVLQCRKWLLALISRFLEQETTDDYKFIITQLCKGPAGIADWSAELIECKPYEQVSTFFESTPQYITHCSALLSELFNSLQHKIKRVTISSGDVNVEAPAAPNVECSDQNWSLIDPRFSCTEELNLSFNSGNTLTESDVIKLCLKIPVAQIFRAYVKKCLEFSEFNSETDKNYEFIMLKLLTIGTIIIKTYQIGLETFNSIQYGNLIEYLSSQVRRTVIVLSDQWSEFKRRLKGVDNALMMRLQVEYDNFMLRSILIILELRQSGIWRHLSRLEQDATQANHDAQSWSTDSLRPALAKILQVTGLSSTSSQTDQQHHVENSEQGLSLAKSSPRSLSESSSDSSSLTYEFSIEWFKEVSEPMLWHILWQFYHSAFIDSCNYHSDNYWVEKFREKSVVYIFVNKIRDSPPSECCYLLNSITSMLLSRTRQDSKLVSFIATEIFNLSYKHEELRDKIAKKGTKALIRCAEKFPNLISLFLSFMVNEEISEDVVDLFKGCSLTGWIFSDDEIGLISQWLIEYSIDSTHNKVARLILTKVLLNSPEFRTERLVQATDAGGPSKVTVQTRSRRSIEQCFVDLKTRRRIALLLYETSKQHLPEKNDFGPQSLGALIEVAFGGIFCEPSSAVQSNLIDIAIDSTYQQLYVWIWRLLFTLRLHILNQPETDWNDVQSRSGTSRSIKNTVLVNDLFHPVPSIQDSECLSLSEGIKNQNPVALYVYLLMTDVTWQADNLDSCLGSLNIMANSSHLTPSLMAMKCLTICHLNDLSDVMVKDHRCLEYFTTIITSNFDVTRFASLLITQMQHLKQYRQLQLSQFYITILLEVANVMIKQQSSSWFSSDEISLDKIACLLDYIVRFNFPTQRLEIIHKFYDCSYSVQGSKTTSGWFGSLFATNSINSNSTRREFLTLLHVLTQKFKKYTWLRWVTAECDSLRLEKIWEDIVINLSSSEEATLDSAIKKVCPQINSSILKSILPIYSWLNQIFDIVESDLSHPLCPLIWYNFFLNYFTNSLNGVSVGLKLIPQETQIKLMTRLDSLFNYHLYKHRNWTSASTLQQNSLAQLYKAYRLWLQDSSLQDAYVDIDRLREDYLVPVLKAVMESSTEGACLHYINLQSIETQNKNLCQIWCVATRLDKNQATKQLVFASDDHDKSTDVVMGVDDEASDAVSLIVKPDKVSNQEQNKLLLDGKEELGKSSIDKIFMSNQSYRSVDETIETIKKNFRIIFEESSVFGSNITALDNIKSEIIDLIQGLYNNKKKEVIRVVPCAEGSECPGPARIKFEIEEATIDDRKSECIQDRQRQCEEIVSEILMMPSNRTVHSSIMIETDIKKLMDDRGRAKVTIESLLSWIKQSDNYNHLNGHYYAANHLLKILLEILSNTEEIDTFNTASIDVCLEHPSSVQILSPHLSPSTCSLNCFLELYSKISKNLSKLGPTAMFVLISKFDISSWLKNINQDKKLHHDIIMTTCLGLREMGKHPDDSFALTFDLYKKHIHVELAPPYRRKPEEISLVLRQFLTIMDEQLLSPSLWTELMSILGLEKRLTLGIDIDGNSPSFLERNDKSMSKNNISLNNSTLISPITTNIEEGSSMLNSVAEDIARFADSQTIFDYRALDNWIEIISEFMNNKCSQINVTLLELYEDYLDQFSIVMISISYMWLRSVSEHYPDNHELNWKKLENLWNNWVFLSKNCQNVGKTSYCLIASQYVAILRYMINKIPDNTGLVLQSILSTLANYVLVTKEVVYLELTILQRCLKKLPWSSFILQPKDFDNLSKLSEQENYNVSDLVSHILLHTNLKESLTKIYENNPELLPHVAERLATTIVMQSTYLKGFRLHGAYFALIPTEQIDRISNLILSRMEFVNLEHSQNNKLLVNLLRFMCIKLEFSTNETEFSSQINDDTSDILERSIIYSKFVSNYFVDLIKNHPIVVKHNKPYIYAIMDNTLQDLKVLLSPDIDITKKTIIYMNLLNCCSNTLIDEDSRLLIAKSLLKSSMLKNRPIVIMEIFYAIGQVINDGRVLVYTIEKMIKFYLNMNGHYEKVWKSFLLSALPSDLYLNACIESNAPLALLVYFESLTHNGLEHSSHHQQVADNIMTTSSEPIINNSKIWSSFFHWISQLSVITYLGSSNELKSNDTRLCIAWIRLLDLLEPNLSQIMCYNRTTSNISAPSVIEQPAQDGVSTGTSSSLESSTKQSDEKESIVDQPARLSSVHKSLIDFLKQLISLFDSCNSGGLWSYLKSTRTEQTSRASIIALAVACFLSDRVLSCLKSSTPVIVGGGDEGNHSNENGGSKTTTRSQQEQQTLLPPQLKLVQDEMLKLRKSSLTKMELARKSKYYLESSHFIEALIESVNRNDKVQYSEGVQLIVTFVKSLYSTTNSDDYISMNKILPTFKE